jgi:hypothetical protein
MLVLYFHAITVYNQCDLRKQSACMQSTVNDVVVRVRMYVS